MTDYVDDPSICPNCGHDPWAGQPETYGGCAECGTEYDWGVIDNVE